MWFSCVFVHIEIAVQFDLDGVNSLIDPTVVARRPSASIRVVVADGESSIPKMLVHEVDDPWVSGGSAQCAGNDIGAS